MASPVGHAMVGLATAAAVARVTGAPSSPMLWIGAFIASGLPDLDLLFVMFGGKGPRFHRAASHSAIVLIGLSAISIGWGPRIGLPPGVAWAWSGALLSHPLLDIVTTGPPLAARGYGIPLLWPFWKQRLYLRTPILHCADFAKRRTLRALWEGVRPEVYRLGPPAALVVVASWWW